MAENEGNKIGGHGSKGGAFVTEEEAQRIYNENVYKQDEAKRLQQERDRTDLGRPPVKNPTEVNR